MFESGYARCREVLEAAKAPGLPVDLQAVIFGGDDYAASISAKRSVENTELLHARQTMVATCRAYGVQAIDIVKIDFKDDDGLRKEALEGSNWGFSGKCSRDVLTRKAY